ncbi:MarR family winged helix-turn-helix transcriptional regulator [Sporomusa sp. KB1]|jgi:DNA-binding MarR family transcriptional regulator|uniref:MarR family winged helix-turn-helix transcriptional regulator n=1 Tax=Sporomusa sp. KB1 TaxID=943346 RepID=UPI0011AC7AB2|nr:MarR family transcriptional regulator [Sporomusa sp. KB1]TWH52131.1 DNA-binding MarR family transcriptional regulator [Sporomusa sp. KB1]
MMVNDVLDTIGFFISRTQSKLQKRFLQKLKPYGVTPEQWALFARLSEKEGISLTDLSYTSLRDKPYTTRLIDKLEQRGLIRREESQDDKRFSLIFLSKQGGELRQEILPIITELNQWVMETLTEAEIKQLKFLLNKLYDQVKD